ncbi:serine hydrolase domain-containing protein [Streptomyces sp. URMC 123]|uniref:serine hydrolase domain-containing protein n=1 Tax=Streptomyces sp. URMC 123 TaxID=3423403 RepID=UPI003F1A5182
MITPSEALLPATDRALLHRIAVAQAEGRTPSLAAAVVRDGRTVWTGFRGAVGDAEPTADTQYRIGSLTKSLIAVLVMRLRDEGLLDLADPLSAHLPGTGVGELTVAQLLSHTAGLAAEPPGPWWERTPGALRPELGDIVGGAPLRHPAGRLHHYSNVGYALLGALVARLRDMPWDEALRREVLDPLGMSRTSVLPSEPYARGWAVHPWADVLLPEPAEETGLMAPAGQLWSTVGDLCRYAAFLADGDARVLGADSLAAMRDPAAPPGRDSWDGGYGLGLQLMRAQGRVLAGHTGSMPGFLATLWVSVADGVGAVVLTNATSGPAVAATAADLVGIVADREPRLPGAWRPLPEVDPELLELTGVWYWGAAPFALRLAAGGSLELSPLGVPGRASRFRPAPDGAGWIGLDGYYEGERLRVVRAGEAATEGGADRPGAVSHLDLGTFVFTREPYEAGAPVPGGVDPQGWRAGES